MREVIKTAKTYEEALEAALQELNASITDVDVLTLEEGSKGLFGLFGSRPYKIRVTLKNSKDEAEDELDIKSLLNGDKPAKKPDPAKKPEPRPARKPEPKPAPAAEDKPAEEKEAKEEKEEKKNRRPEPVRRVNPDRKPAEAAAPAAPAPTEEAADEEEEEDNAAVQVPGDAPARKRRRRHRSRGGKKPAAAAEAQEAPAEPKPPVKPLEKPVVTMIAAEELDPESAAGRAKAFLQELTSLMGVNVTIDMGTDAEGNVYGYMNGDTLGILIGRRGETLDALQYLTSLKINKGQEGYTRVTLDTENYRAKREDTLIRLANRKANHAVKTGRKVALDPMNPYERRIIHSALQSNDAVETHSEGEEPNRHVVITLRKA